MAIQLKRGLKDNLPTTAAPGEPLFCLDTKELYVGTETGVAKIQASADMRGESAYEVAVNNGFVGTEQEWLNSLIGTSVYKCSGTFADKAIPAAAYTQVIPQASLGNSAMTNASGNFVAPADGLYVLSVGNLRGGAVGALYTELWKNTVSFTGQSTMLAESGNNTGTVFNGLTTIEYLNKGDFLSTTVWSNVAQTTIKGGTASPHFTFALIGSSVGASAYEIAVKNGFVGTELEWLNSLIAPTPAITDMYTVANIGEIFWWAQSTPPADSLVCDGRAISRTNYSELFNVIGTTFGTGDGSTTFNLPDLRGEFIRGYDPSNARDPMGSTRGFGKHQDGTSQPLISSWRDTSANALVSIPIAATTNTGVNPTGTDSIKYTGLKMKDYALATTNGGGDSATFTSRPTNINLLPCIRYRRIVASNNGLSAYELAVNNGFVGTQQEWLNSLKGDKGNDATGAPLVNNLSTTTSNTYALDAAQGSVLDTKINTKASNNYIINGNFDIWQRGTSHSVSGYGSDDRWAIGSTGSTFTNSRQAFLVGQTDVPNNPTYFCRVVVNSVPGTSNRLAKIQRIENVSRLSNKTVTVSFWAKADANKDIAIELVQNFGTSGSTAAFAYSQRVSLTSTWNKFVITANLPSVADKTISADSRLELFFWFDAGADFDSRTAYLGQQSGTFDIAQVQLIEGNVDTNYIPRTFQEELKLCQRYYEKSYSPDVAPGTVTLIGSTMSGAPNVYNINTPLVFKTTKRTIPTVKMYSTKDGAVGYICDSTGSPVNKAVSPAEVSENLFAVYGASTLVSGTVYRVHWTADAEL